ncbi:putative integral membrane protein [Acanthocheilonema viteae]
MVIRILRKMCMANTSVGSFTPGTADISKDYKNLKKRHDVLKNPFVLSGIVLPWIVLNGFLKPHSERVSFAEHRFRIFLQFCTFVTVLSVATVMRKIKSED